MKSAIMSVIGTVLVMYMYWVVWHFMSNGMADIESDLNNY
uniref:ATP synthase F0 subunit 8 n=1 Tax=Crassostrea talonata TaxID=1356040 RepID=A0A342KBA6_9BIVA|nr:ATP synthase F0 subunit 8 [Crassostrea talonata]ANC95449.1 ATP synthase F0 subunit 8 [Crassostrea talonata]ANC95461.1 ATP synthase F0 subunit 8 [Crassostrea talonata]UOU85754.1 ATP synthase F0 subunit 8 [Crassostrea talonata]